MDKQEFMIAMGKRVKTCRERLDMSQEELAQKLGYKNKASISKIEAGKNEIPQSKMVDFADILDTNVSYLMGWGDVSLSEFMNLQADSKYYQHEEEKPSVREELRDNYAYRLLFNTAEGATDADLLEAAALIARRKEERGNR